MGEENVFGIHALYVPCLCSHLYSRFQLCPCPCSDQASSTKPQKEGNQGSTHFCTRDQRSIKSLVYFLWIATLQFSEPSYVLSSTLLSNTTRLFGCEHKILISNTFNSFHDDLQYTKIVNRHIILNFYLASRLTFDLAQTKKPFLLTYNLKHFAFLKFN